MKHLLTKGIVLRRTDYGEADRIITVLTTDQGKLSLMARGVRKPKSKLAGGIELLSVSDITFIHGKGEIGTLISSRLIDHYAKIVQDINRVQLGYDLIKQIDKATEDRPESEYFDTLKASLKALDDQSINLDLIRLWFQVQLLDLGGHAPNLSTDSNDNKLSPDLTYNFDYERVAFTDSPRGNFSSDHIKLLRLVFAGQSLTTLNKIQNLDQLLPVCQQLVRTMLTTYIRL